MSLVVKTIKIRSRSLANNPVTDCVAYMNDTTKEWLDPHGGEFSEDEQTNLDAFLAGKREALTLDRYYNDLFVTVHF